MKYECPFCKIMMSYVVEKQYDSNGNPIIDYLIHKCKKSECKIGLFPKHKIWEYKEQVQGFSIILDDCLTTYKIVSRYDMNKTTLSKVQILTSPNGMKGPSFNRIIEIDDAIKIDLVDPINSGLQTINRLMKLRAFS